MELDWRDLAFHHPRRHADRRARQPRLLDPPGPRAAALRALRQLGRHAVRARARAAGVRRIADARRHRRPDVPGLPGRALPARSLLYRGLRAARLGPGHARVGGAGQLPDDRLLPALLQAQHHRRRGAVQPRRSTERHTLDLPRLGATAHITASATWRCYAGGLAPLGARADAASACLTESFTGAGQHAGPAVEAGRNLPSGQAPDEAGYAEHFERVVQPARPCSADGARMVEGGAAEPGGGFLHPRDRRAPGHLVRDRARPQESISTRSSAVKFAVLNCSRCLLRAGAVGAAPPARGTKRSRRPANPLTRPRRLRGGRILSPRCAENSRQACEPALGPPIFTPMTTPATRPRRRLPSPPLSPAPIRAPRQTGPRLWQT